MRHYYDVKDMLVEYPLVSEDAPEWKKICPFCGAFDEIHEVENTYVCHECFANWIEYDTETERQIQVLYLNDGKMPIVERQLRKYVEIVGIVDLERDEVLFFNGGAENDKLVASF
ncbi:MAG: hypothetical protein IJP96_02470 [Synergistaceae bacterium]|nr:hypothetical protein [Synergistaceae bacterium]